MGLTGAELLRIWFVEVWDKKRAEAIDEYASPDWAGHDLHLPGGPDMPWRERFKAVYHAYRDAFPDITITVDQTVDEGEIGVARCTIRGTHSGHGLALLPTGRTIDITGMVMVRVLDSQIVESWETWNFLKMYAQLGTKLGVQPLA